MFGRDTVHMDLSFVQMPDAVPVWCSFHMLDNRYKENRLKKHLQSKKITDPHALDLLSKLLALDPKKTDICLCCR